MPRANLDPMPPPTAVNLEAERAVLGCILLESATLPCAIKRLTPEDFYKDGHRKIYEAMLSLFERSEPADSLTVTEELRRVGALDVAGGRAALAVMMEEATTATQFDSYTRIVRETARKRALAQITHRANQAAVNGRGSEQVVAELTRELAALPPATPTEDDEAEESAPMVGQAILDTPVTEPDWTVDQLFSHRSQHMFVGPSQGAKTWVLYDLAVALGHPTVDTFLGQRIHRHGPVWIDSWEQGRPEDLRRMQKLLRGRGLGTCDENLILVSAPPGALSDESYWQRRVQGLRARGAIAYLFDSLSEAAGIELNDNTLYTAWWRRRIKPILDLGVMVVFTHLRGHAKPGVAQDRDSASRGATQIRALSTGVVETRQIDETRFLLKHNKHRDGPALRLGILELQGGFTDGAVSLTLTPAEPAGSKDLLARRLLTELGSQAPEGRLLVRADFERALNAKDRSREQRVSKKTYEPVLTAMTDEGLFEAVKQGRADAWRWTFNEVPEF